MYRVWKKAGLRILVSEKNESQESESEYRSPWSKKYSRDERCLHSNRPSNAEKQQINNDHKQNFPAKQMEISTVLEINQEGKWAIVYTHR